jgi:hypothetical protein
MVRYYFPFLLFFMFVFPSVGWTESADAPSEVPRLFGIFQPKEGAWSKYIVTEKQTGRKTLMRMSIVGKENGSYWYEVINDEEGARNVVKMLVKGDPNDPENILRLIMKSGQGPAQEMPRDFVLMGRRMANHMFEQRSGIPSSQSADLKNEIVGKDEVKVPAGTFSVTSHQIVDANGKVYAEYKFSKTIHPFGVVTSDTENTSMVLLDHGTGAKSLITGTPAMMTQPPGMPQGMPRGMPPGMEPPPGRGPGSEIQQVPGMGTGYEPKR